PEKGLLELVAELAANRDAWSAATVVASSQDVAYEERVRDAAANVDGIDVRTDVTDVAPLLGEADVLVMPSTGNEGQPTVIIEAVGAGLAVVVRRPMFSADYERLPVSAYDDAGNLGAALEARPREPADLKALAARFGPQQALAGIEAAALVLRRADA